jgi:short-subunit dehydrogenase
MAMKSPLFLAMMGLLLILPLFAQGLAPAAAKTHVIAGASGYIGKSVVKESVRQGYHTVALVRNVHKIRTPQYEPFFRGATVVECDVTDPLAVNQVCTCRCACPSIILYYIIRQS